MKVELITGTVLAALVLAGPARAQKAVPSVEMTDPAGDVYKSDKPENSRDVVKLSLSSDGTNILVAATLNQDERGTVAGSVVELYLDTDNKPATGGKSFRGPEAGFEYHANLSVCMAFDAERISACEGGPDLPVKSRHARIFLERFKGATGEEITMMNSETLIDNMGYVDSPFQGRVLQGKIPYAKLGVKPGQIVRVLAQEAHATDDGFFPDVLLGLK